MMARLCWRGWRLNLGGYTVTNKGAWMPAVGNVATVMCFAICLILNVNITGGSNRAIFFLAFILLLLNQDSGFVAGFGDKQRYFPVTVVISAYLILTAPYSIWEDVWHGNAGWGLEIGGPDCSFAVKNAALLILTFPSHILFNRFVWSYTKQTDSMSLLTFPLNLPPIITADVIVAKILGLLGIIYSLGQYQATIYLRIELYLGKLSQPVKVIAFRHEKGVRFQSTCLGSAAIAGILPVSAIADT
ncbi:hypothetical protein F0562_035085 [Nyssa sinensis]|uniref:Uncharacterized protein n=1 Tax=Nyssa sinensis TaxID=561372 RepID=A0A5J5AEA4_9ASTE|nr:hypothetical protein F0562_035085 [Nyssa sinensis]